MLKTVLFGFRPSVPVPLYSPPRKSLYGSGLLGLLTLDATYPPRPVRRPYPAASTPRKTRAASGRLDLPSVIGYFVARLPASKELYGVDAVKSVLSPGPH